MSRHMGGLAILLYLPLSALSVIMKLKSWLVSDRTSFSPTLLRLPFRRYESKKSSICIVRGSPPLNSHFGTLVPLPAFCSHLFALVIEYSPGLNMNSTAWPVIDPSWTSNFPRVGVPIAHLMNTVRG